MFSKVEEGGAISKMWEMTGLDMTANVVCKSCNETCMSDIEAAAKVAMTDLILGNPVTVITAEQAARIANFAFKTAIISDRIMNGHFFDISVRYDFKKSRAIPSNVRMWLFSVETNAFEGAIRSRNIYFPNKTLTDLTLNVCSFFAGRFGFQVVSLKTDFVRQIEALPTPPGLTLALHEATSFGISWPPSVALTPDRFDAFASRWDSTRYGF